MRRALYYVAIDGRDVSATLDPVLVSLRIHLTAKSRADSCTIVLDDRDAQILMPRTGAKLEAGLRWSDGGRVVQFEGTVDRPVHTTGRGQGDLLTIQAQSAERKGKLKARRHAHHDDGTLKDAAEKFGKAAGVTVKVDEALGRTKRAYWAMHGETFMAWGARVARELGATFKVMGSTAVFVPRGAGKSASGQALRTIEVKRRYTSDGTQLGNLITSSLSPVETVPEFKKVSVRWYDRKAAKWKTKDVEVDGAGDGVDAVRTPRWSAPDEGQAEARGKSNKADSRREKGGGTVTILGEPAALPEANADCSGIRPGLDGTYRIDEVDHEYSRKGWETTLALKQPQKGGADGTSTPGTDARAAGARGASS